MLADGVFPLKPSERIGVLLAPPLSSSGHRRIVRSTHHSPQNSTVEGPSLSGVGHSRDPDPLGTPESCAACELRLPLRRSGIGGICSHSRSRASLRAKSGESWRLVVPRDLRSCGDVAMPGMAAGLQKPSRSDNRSAEIGLNPWRELENASELLRVWFFWRACAALAFLLRLAFR